MKYKVYAHHNYEKIPQINRLTPGERFDIDVVAKVLPFKTNNYVVDELIDWDNYQEDPLYILTFPQRGMLEEHHFNRVSRLILNEASQKEISIEANHVRMDLNPHPAGQMRHNVPEMNGQRLQGIQHKYRETVLFFPTQGQTCHAYCTFCFRWPQFTGQSDLKIAMKQADVLVEYLERHPEVTDLLFTGGDPMIMKSSIFENYIDAILEADLPHLQTIRVGSKTLSFWPYRYLTDNDADDLLRVFERVVKSGRHLAFMAHFNHYNELKTEAVKQAIKRIQNTGAQIRTQAPVLNHINSHPYVWSRMWEEQVNLGMVPYYMFIPRETGAQQYFALPLVQIYEIYRQAYKQVSGICRTVRGPSMSAHPGKIQVLGTPEINGRKTIAMNFIQGRNPDWVKKPFFAKYDEDALWINELEPAFGEDEFFFEEELHAWLVS